MQEILKGTNLIKKYGNQVVLNKLSISVTKGEFITITGRSGSGKSTLLKCLGSMLKPDSGEVILDGEDLYKLQEKKLCQVRNNKFGFIFQTFALENKYTAFENIEIPLILSGGIKKEERIERINLLAKQLNINNILNKSAGGLSGGEKQRVAIARAVINNPEILFADEPCGNLDRYNGEVIMGIFKQLVQSGFTILMVTHQEEDALLADRIIRIEDGKFL